jgi:hypothetical protein
MKISNIERFSLTHELLKTLADWNDSWSYPILGPCAARIVGFITTPLTSLIDAIAHSILFVGKTITGVVISPYNFIVKHFFDSKYLAPSELEIGSALIHLAVATRCFPSILAVPLITLISPNFAEYIADPARMFMSDIELLAEAFAPLAKV